jgi:uncharacterized protein (DUF58 family)
MPPEDHRKNISELLDPLLVARLGRLSLVARHVVEGVIAGLHRSPYRGLSMEFTEHRQYVPGDEIRRIDWKAYGRLDKYFIKEYEEETNLKAYIMVDCSASMGYGRELSKFRYASLLAASLAYLLLRQRDSVGLVTYNDGIRKLIPPRSAVNHLEIIAGELEGRETGGETDTGRAVEMLASSLKRRSLIIIISDVLDDPERFALSLKQLRHKRNEAIVFQVLDDDEISFPFKRPTLFLDLESEERITTSPEDIKKEYKRILARHLERVKRSCHSNFVDYELFPTDGSLSQALVRYLARRED